MNKKILAYYRKKTNKLKKHFKKYPKNKKYKSTFCFELHQKQMLAIVRKLALHPDQALHEVKHLKQNKIVSLYFQLKKISKKKLPYPGFFCSHETLTLVSFLVGENPEKLILQFSSYDFKS